MIVSHNFLEKTIMDTFQNVSGKLSHFVKINFFSGRKDIHYPKEITKYYEEHRDSGFFNKDIVICEYFNCDVRLVNKTHTKVMK